MIYNFIMMLKIPTLEQELNCIQGKNSKFCKSGTSCQAFTRVWVGFIHTDWIQFKYWQIYEIRILEIIKSSSVSYASFSVRYSKQEVAFQ